MRSRLQPFIEEFQKSILTFHDATPRELSLPDLCNKIKVVIGMRRTGKTHFLLQRIKKMLSDNPAILTRILYLNFEDDRLLPLTASTLGELLDEFYTLYPENHDKECFFILDEIQNVPQWEITVRRFFDTKKVDIYLTGSSAKLLSKEIATSLRGRSLATEMWPFSFNEYLVAKKIAPPKKPFGKISQDRFLKILRDYLQSGGFPEVINLEAIDRNRILQDYVDVVIFRDIIERYNISNITLVKYLIKTLITNSGAPFSVNKFFNDLKSQGMNVSKMTIHDYLGYIEDAYLVFSVPLYSESLRKVQTNPRKIYTIDTGLIYAYTNSISENLGHLFENLFYIDLRRRGYEVYYYLTAERYEVDFLVKDYKNELQLFQVVWDASNSETMEREKRALKAAEKELNIKGKIITPDIFLI